MLRLSLVILVISIAATRPSAQSVNWAKRVDSGNGPEAITNIQFYFHDIVSGSNPTAEKVVEPVSGSTTGFGQINIADDPLTETSDPKSKLLGRAQGLYGSAGENDMALLMVMSYGFTDGPYKGSSLSIMGKNPAMNPTRELPVLGGTGLFRMARGYALMKTVSFNSAGDAVVHYNVTVHAPADNEAAPGSTASVSRSGGGATGSPNSSSASSSSSPVIMRGKQWVVSALMACTAFVCLSSYAL
ncbi:Dirigent protein 23 [Linum perenne]